MLTLGDSLVRRVEDPKNGAVGISDSTDGEVAIARGVPTRAGLTVGKDVNLLSVGETPGRTCARS
ncbi:MAG: hypothetical protein AUH81_21190 [Candidatus Rokubacteria bacterium 13_1_40CM_4_69_5]|nr:MAG: hypothetical protein AUH81_21190 [Candidatus Rokubacteria bacterium 13_1_40CM_4_69_5]